jgi:alkanesulfonate monooxygenase SsuD/methylene tetrahydromethanopterin reductase-like flavin-dependent oxidoreductase (luciferase family)
MRFGLFCTAQANSGDLPPESGQGFRDYLDFNVEAEAIGFHSSFLVEHHFTGSPVSPCAPPPCASARR